MQRLAHHNSPLRPLHIHYTKARCTGLAQNNVALLKICGERWPEPGVRDRCLTRRVELARRRDGCEETGLGKLRFLRDLGGGAEELGQAWKYGEERDSEVYWEGSVA